MGASLGACYHALDGLGDHRPLLGGQPAREAQPALVVVPGPAQVPAAVSLARLLVAHPPAVAARAASWVADRRAARSASSASVSGMAIATSDRGWSRQILPSS